MRIAITLALAICALSLAPIAAQTLETFDTATPGNPGIYPLGWVDGGGSEVWRVHTGTTGSSGTGPSGDHTSGIGNYMYTEASGASGPFILNVRPFDTTGVIPVVLDYWVHMTGANLGTFSVEEKIGGVWTPVDTLVGDQGPSWINRVVPLTGGAITEIRFVHDLYTGFAADACIDDVIVPGSYLPLPYQANSPAASLDINGVQTTLFAPAVAALTIDLDSGGAAHVEATGAVTLSTNVSGQWWEIVQNNVPLIPAPTAISLPSGVVNLDVLASFSGINGGAGAIGLAPFTAWPGQVGGTLIIPFSIDSVLSLSSQAVVTDASAPGGFNLSQATTLDVTQNLIVPGTINPTTPFTGVSDDGLFSVGMSGTFTFYGVGYTNIFVASNGILSFGPAISSFSNSVASMEAGGASIAPCWDDLSPQNGNGMMGVYDDGIVFEAVWHRTPRFGGSGESTFGVTLDYATGIVEMRYGNIAPSGTMSSTAGISAGAAGTPGAPLVDLNVPTGVPQPNPLDSIIEDFGSLNFFDLGILPGATTPNIVTFLPQFVPGIPPYLLL